MNNKLQELTDRLYREGLSKGQEEGDKILEEARKSSEQIIAKASEQAAAIVADAEKSAAALKSKVESDLKMASSQTLQAVKKDIENAVVAKVSDEKVEKILSDPDFLKDIIKEVAAGFGKNGAGELSVILPESMKARLEPFVKESVNSELGKGVKASFSKKVAGGFTIGPADGSWFVNFSDESFKALIGEYLRPVTRKFLFGK